MSNLNATSPGPMRRQRTSQKPCTVNGYKIKKHVRIPKSHPIEKRGKWSIRSAAVRTVDVALVFAHTIENMQKMCTIVVVSTLPLQATRSALQAPSDDAGRAFCDQKRSQLKKIMSMEVLFWQFSFWREHGKPHIDNPT